MPKPPPTTPHSDMDGIHQDEARNTDSASWAGEDAGDLQEARDRSKGRPPESNDQPPRDDRSR